MSWRGPAARYDSVSKGEPLSFAHHRPITGGDAESAGSSVAPLGLIESRMTSILRCGSGPGTGSKLTEQWEIESVSSVLEGKRVLLVDDDPDMITALRAVLHDTGAEITAAYDGNQALEMAVAHDPDIIVLDAMLPKRSGFLVLEKLKGPAKKKGQRPYIIMITGNTGKRHQIWAQSLGVDGYFNKPFRMERLLESMEKVCGNGSESK